MSAKAQVQAVYWHARCRRGRYGYMVFSHGHYASMPNSTLRVWSSVRTTARDAWDAALVSVLAEVLTQ